MVAEPEPAESEQTKLHAESAEEVIGTVIVKKKGSNDDCAITMMASY